MIDLREPLFPEEQEYPTDLAERDAAESSAHLERVREFARSYDADPRRYEAVLLSLARWCASEGRGVEYGASDVAEGMDLMTHEVEVVLGDLALEFCTAVENNDGDSDAPPTNYWSTYTLTEEQMTEILTRGARGWIEHTLRDVRPEPAPRAVLRAEVESYVRGHGPSARHLGADHVAAHFACGRAVVDREMALEVLLGVARESYSTELARLRRGLKLVGGSAEALALAARRVLDGGGPR